MPRWSCLPYCQANGIGVVVYSPMAGGHPERGVHPRAHDLAAPRRLSGATTRQYQEPQLSKNLELVERGRTVHRRAARGMTVAQLAIAWVLRRLEVTSAIVGARRPSQIEETSKASEKIDLTDAEIAEINALLAARAKHLT